MLLDNICSGGVWVVLDVVIGSSIPATTASVSSASDRYTTIHTNGETLQRQQTALIKFNKLYTRHASVEFGVCLLGTSVRITRYMAHTQTTFAWICA